MSVMQAAGSGPRTREPTEIKERRPHQLAFWALLLLPMLIVLALVFGIPIADLVVLSFHKMAGPATVSDAFTISNYTDFISDTFFIRILLDTFRLGLTVVICCLVIGYPVAYFVARTRSRWRGVLLFLVISPLLVSTIVRNIGWFPILSDAGLVNWMLLRTGLISEPLKLMSNFTGVVIGLTHALLPFMVLILATVIQRIEPELQEASANLGAGPIETFWRVLLPLSLPGVLSGSLLVLTLAISAYTTPAVLGGNRVLVMAIYIAQRFRTVLDYATGATAAALLMLTAAVLTFLALRLRPGEWEGR